MACPQNKQVVWIDESRGQTSRSQAWISEQEAALHYVFQPFWRDGGRHSAQEDYNDQPPLHRNSAGKSCACPGAANKLWNHKNSVTP